VQLQVVSAPGRELRDGEPVERRLSSVVSSIAEAVLADARLPVAFFGHSFGGMVAYETAVRLKETYAAPTHLIVSAREAPRPADDRRTHDVDQLHLLPDASLLTAVRTRFGGFPVELDDEPELLQEMLDRVRVDLDLLSQAPKGDRPRLPMPISVFFSPDDQSQAEAEIRRWSDYAETPVSFESFVGGHSYPAQDAAAVVNRVLARLG